MCNVSQENQPSYYAIIPSQVRYCEELKFAERLLYGEITALTGKEGYCFAGNKYFAELYNVTTETISRWISHLNRLGFISVEIVRSEKKEVLERRIYITDNSKGRIVYATYCSKNQYPYCQNNQYPIDEKIKDNNINIRIDRLFNYIINNNSAFPMEFTNKAKFNEFYEIIKRLELNYTEDVLRFYKDENIEKLKVMIYCVSEIFLSNKKILLARITREELINLYDNCKSLEISYQNTDNEIINFLEYYHSSVIKKLEAKII